MIDAYDVRYLRIGALVFSIRAINQRTLA